MSVSQENWSPLRWWPRRILSAAVSFYFFASDPVIMVDGLRGTGRRHLSLSLFSVFSQLHYTGIWVSGYCYLSAGKDGGFVFLLKRKGQGGGGTEGEREQIPGRNGELVEADIFTVIKILESKTHEDVQRLA